MIAGDGNNTSIRASPVQARRVTGGSSQAPAIQFVVWSSQKPAPLLWILNIKKCVPLHRRSRRCGDTEKMVKTARWCYFDLRRFQDASWSKQGSWSVLTTVPSTEIDVKPAQDKVPRLCWQSWARLKNVFTQAGAEPRIVGSICISAIMLHIHQAALSVCKLKLRPVFSHGVIGWLGLEGRDDARTCCMLCAGQKLPGMQSV